MSDTAAHRSPLTAQHAWDLVAVYALRSRLHRAREREDARSVRGDIERCGRRGATSPIPRQRSATVDAELIPDVLLHAVTVLALTERRGLWMDELSTRSTESKVPTPWTFMIARSRSSHDVFLLLEIAVAGSA